MPDQTVLLIDVGNTKSKLALAQGGRMVSDVRIADHETTLREARSMAQAGNAACCLMSSVAAGAKSLLESLSYSGLPTSSLSSSMRMPFAIDYATPHTLGSDRIAGVAGIVAERGLCDALVIDAGTAITYDFLSADGHFRGGAISPGIRMRFKALHGYTAQLPLCDPDEGTGDVVGTDTRSAIVSGVMNGVWAEADFFIAQIRQKCADAPIFISGGDSEYFDLTTKIGIFARPNLVLEGLALLAQMNIDEIIGSRIG